MQCHGLRQRERERERGAALDLMPSTSLFLSASFDRRSMLVAASGLAVAGLGSSLPASAAVSDATLNKAVGGAQCITYDNVA